MAVCPPNDFHIHTLYLGCADKTMEIPAIVERCSSLGVKAIGITDHLNSIDRLPLHRPILKDIQALEGPCPEIYFGVELNFPECDSNFVYSEEIRDEYGFQFAIGGIHALFLEEYDLKKLVDIQHRHHMKACADPLLDVLVHPYWFSLRMFEPYGWPWFDSMSAVPDSYARELGKAAKESNTAIEINASAIFTNSAYSEAFKQEYLRWLSLVAEEGALFSVGSDAHNINVLDEGKVAWEVATGLNLPMEQFWRPNASPLKP
ncbi:MAG: PHP domain-containing protein [Candidatus Ratteibacteria bacterium]|jgi:histidinol phosphatase-like PHP family hydrolase